MVDYCHDHSMGHRADDSDRHIDPAYLSDSRHHPDAFFNPIVSLLPSGNQQAQGDPESLNPPERGRPVFSGSNLSCLVSIIATLGLAAVGAEPAAAADIAADSASLRSRVLAGAFGRVVSLAHVESGKQFALAETGLVAAEPYWHLAFPKSQLGIGSPKRMVARDDELLVIGDSCGIAIVNTDKGALTSSLLRVDSKCSLNDIYVGPEGTAVVGGVQGGSSFLATIAGRTVELNSHPRLDEIDAVWRDATGAVVAGSRNGALVILSQEGMNWDAYTVPGPTGGQPSDSLAGNPRLLDIGGVSRDDLWVVGGQYSILGHFIQIAVKSLGESWEPVHIGEGPSLRQLLVVDGEVWAVGALGTVATYDEANGLFEARYVSPVSPQGLECLDYSGDTLWIGGDAQLASIRGGLMTYFGGLPRFHQLGLQDMVNSTDSGLACAVGWGGEPLCLNRSGGFVDLSLPVQIASQVQDMAIDASGTFWFSLGHPSADGRVVALSRFGHLTEYMLPDAPGVPVLEAAADGSVLAVAARFEPSGGDGQSVVYRWSGTTWRRIHELSGSYVRTMADLENGWVAAGSTVIVGDYNGSSSVWPTRFRPEGRDYVAVAADANTIALATTENVELLSEDGPHSRELRLADSGWIVDTAVSNGVVAVLGRQSLEVHLPDRFVDVELPIDGLQSLRFKTVDLECDSSSCSVWAAGRFETVVMAEFPLNSEPPPISTPTRDHVVALPLLFMR